MFKKFFVAVFVFVVIAIPTLPLLAQTFDSEAANAHAAVTTLQSAAENKVAGLSADNAALVSTNNSLTDQLHTLQTTSIYRDAEWHRWGMNCAAQVGGSGNGQGSQVQAPGASFSIVPVKPATGTSNYFDCYYPDDVAPDDAKKHFSLTMPWQFPTLTDSNASQALEMEIRQSLTGGLQGVCALQMNFSGNQLRIFDHVNKWFSTGVTQPRFTPGVVYLVTLDCHRDDANNVVYDAITINGKRIAVIYSYPYWQDNWRPMLRYAGQLDGKGSGIPYTVKRGPDSTVFKSW